MADRGQRAGQEEEEERRRRLLVDWSRLHRPALLRFFRRRLPSHADQEDLVQEVFLSLARHRNLQEIERADSYLFQAAANVLTDWRRRQKSRNSDAHDEFDDALPDDATSPEDAAIGRDRLRRLTAALGALPARTQAVFVLYHFEGLSQAAVGRRLGIAVRTVEDHMRRANLHLLQRMDDFQ